MPPSCGSTCRASQRRDDFHPGHELAAGRGFVEVLAEVPGPSVVLAPLLQIAARHVQADRVAKDEIVGAAHVDAPAALAERDNELGLVVVVRSLRRVMYF